MVLVCFPRPGLDYVYGCITVNIQNTPHDQSPLFGLQISIHIPYGYKKKVIYNLF